MPEIERKSYSLKADLEDNFLKGNSSAIGNMDLGDDVIFPGSYKGCLKAFKESGFVAVGHDWHDLPIAMPVTAEERGKFLYTEAMFHSTQRAQDARTVCKERLENGKTVGLSIGYGLAEGGYMWFPNGKELLKYAKAQGYDMDLFDTREIESHEGYCRGIFKIASLFEYSVVTVPMNPKATATQAKDGIAKYTLRDLEKALRVAGVSRNQSRKVLKEFAPDQWDAGMEDDPEESVEDFNSRPKILAARQKLLSIQTDLMKAGVNL